MNNVLLAGNGFDLAHGLPTSYNDFFKVMKEWDEFYKEIKRYVQDKTIDETSMYYRYLHNITDIDINNIERLNGIFQNNSWVQYFRECGAEIDGWIDFEREIYPVMELFEFIFNTTYEMTGNIGEPYGNACIKRDNFTPQLRRKARLWKKYIDARGADTIIIKTSYASMQYGILKKKIIKSLIDEFNEFIEAFEIYLVEFVHKRNDVKMLKQIQEMNINSVVSFNYTLTERLYGIAEKDVHHIHGKIRENPLENNNMVMGVSEQEKQNIDFIYFVKFFQRMQKKSGIRYKMLTKRKIGDGRYSKGSYVLHIYGHSLDETDEDILKYMIGDINSRGNLILKPELVNIYYYDDNDFAQKTINLIKLYGRTIVEKELEDRHFKFIHISNTTI